jgi:hypothetical protein
MKRGLLAIILLVVAAPIVEAAFRSGRYTVTTTAAAYYTAPRRGATVVLCNRAAASVFLGGDNTLTAANGFELLAGDCTSQTPYRGDSIWLIVAAATARVDWAEGSYPR